jgi:CRISPR system Cascade subunit CasD
MDTLLLCFDAPFQSWGDDSRFDYRFTRAEPTKSGVLGLVSAALGKPSVERPGDGFPTLAQLSALNMGVRIDRPGIVDVDYQISKDVLCVDGTIKSAEESRRYYLVDSRFLVGLEAKDRILLDRISAALKSPVFPIYFGRKACVIERPLYLGIIEKDLVTALKEHPWYYRFAKEKKFIPKKLRLVLDSKDTTDEFRQDVPLDFNTRRFSLRYVKNDWCDLSESQIRKDNLCFSQKPC